MDFTGMDPKDARKAQRGWDLAAKHRIERAAPELLAALEQVVEWLDRTGESRSAGGMEYGYVTDARTAVASARGVHA